MKQVLFILYLFCLGLSAQDSPVDQEDLIGFGDQVHITMKEDEEVFFEGEVSTNGFVTLPFLGATHIYGRTEREAEIKLKADLEKELYQKATMSVVVVKKAIGYVYLYGAVEEAGRVEIPPEGKIASLQAIAEGKGLSKWGNPNAAYVLKKDARTELYTKHNLNLEKAYNDLSSADNIILTKDDILVIPSLADGAVAPGSIQVMVAGKVEKPGVVLFEPGETPSLVRAILKAGNFNKFADKRKVRIVRKTPTKTEIIKVNVAQLLDEGEIERDIKLLSGDLIIIDESWI